MNLTPEELKALDLMGTYNRFVFWWPLHHRNIERIMSQFEINQDMHFKYIHGGIKDEMQNIFKVHGVNGIVRPRANVQGEWIATSEPMQTVVVVPYGFKKPQPSARFLYVTEAELITNIDNSLHFKRIIVFAPLTENLRIYASLKQEAYFFADAPSKWEPRQMHLWYSIFKPCSYGEFIADHYNRVTYPVANHHYGQSNIGIKPTLKDDASRNLEEVMHERIWLRDDWTGPAPLLFRQGHNLSSILWEIGRQYSVMVVCKNIGEALDAEDMYRNTFQRCHFASIIFLSYRDRSCRVQADYVIFPDKELIRDFLSPLCLIHTKEVDYAN